MSLEAELLQDKKRELSAMELDVKPELVPVNEMTSKDYYFDSYAHFGIHEVYD